MRLKRGEYNGDIWKKWRGYCGISDTDRFQIDCPEYCYVAGYYDGVTGDVTPSIKQRREYKMGFLDAMGDESDGET